MNKPNNVIRIKSPLDKDFFKNWFIFLTPFHHLTNREIDVIATFVKERYELSKVIKDDSILDKVTMSDETKRKVRSSCNISLAHFQVIMSNLRKNGLIVDGKINPKFIPNITENSDMFTFLLLFDLE